jgi:hypothetical protein
MPIGPEKTAGKSFVEHPVNEYKCFGGLFNTCTFGYLKLKLVSYESIRFSMLRRSSRALIRGTPEHDENIYQPDQSDYW